MRVTVNGEPREIASSRVDALLSELEYEGTHFAIALNYDVLPKSRWAETALKAGGHPDYTLRILPKANHYQWEAKTGSNAEMASLQRFVPEYFKTIDDWLAKRVRGFGAVPAR